jgi:hypothetical protein
MRSVRRIKNKKIKPNMQLIIGQSSKTKQKSQSNKLSLSLPPGDESDNDEGDAEDDDGRNDNSSGGSRAVDGNLTLGIAYLSTPEERKTKTKTLSLKVHFPFLQK